MNRGTIDQAWSWSYFKEFLKETCCWFTLRKTKGWNVRLSWEEERNQHWNCQGTLLRNSLREDSNRNAWIDMKRKQEIVIWGIW